MKKTLVFSAIAGIFLATPAMAQEDNRVDSGLRIEAIVGWDRVSSALDGTSDYDSNEDGLGYGIGLGYDVVAGSFVVGAEAEIAESTTGVSQTFLNEVIDGSDVTGTLALDASEDIYVGGRLGTVLGGTGILYVKGGYSMANAELTAKGTIDGEPIDERVSGDFEGWRMGAGFETKLSGGLFTKIEYRYTSYSDASVEHEGTSVDVDEAFDYIDLDRHQVVVGIGYRF